MDSAPPAKVGKLGVFAGLGAIAGLALIGVAIWMLVPAHGWLANIRNEGEVARIAPDHGRPITPVVPRIRDDIRPYFESHRTQLEGTGLAYGRGRAAAHASGALALAVRAAASAPAAAERAEYKARLGFAADSDLAQAVAENRLALKDVKEDELPDALRGLPEERREARFKEIAAEREKLKGELDALAGERAAWLKKRASPARADSFDARLAEALKAQAAKKGILY